MFVKLLKYNSSFAYAFGNVRILRWSREGRKRGKRGGRKREWEEREEGGFVRSAEPRERGERCRRRRRE